MVFSALPLEPAPEWSALLFKVVVALLAISSITTLTAVILLLVAIVSGITLLRRAVSFVSVFRMALVYSSVIAALAVALCVLVLMLIFTAVPIWITLVISIALVPVLSWLIRETVLFFIWKRFGRLIYFFRFVRALLRPV
ncbi:MAG: hypothetical protein NZM35_04265 [Chitinophagales bacterium]|nr:hypothetical protein [Chitinophagales bacterium]MDW8418416.1 hypothetical protein [Chitinophagales bacterium]